MSIYWYGGDLPGYVVTAGVGNTAVFAPGAIIKAWPDRQGGEPYTDLADADGAPITQVVASDGTGGYPLGGLPRFKAPAPAVWLGVDEQPRVLALTTDMPELIATVGAVANETSAASSAHTASLNGHGTGLANLTDTAVGTPESRTAGHVVGWDTAAGVFRLLAPSQVAGAILLDPPPQGGTYVGNVATAPPAAQGQSGNPWLRMQQPYSAGDNNPDAIQLGSTTDTGQWIKTNWSNGNNERRAAPSTKGRIADRVFEYAETLGGPSTGRFVEWSTNPVSAANREPLLAGYGTGHPSQPGWVVATRVLAGLLGVRAGGSYNSLTAINLRGQRAAAGPPDSGNWATGDIVLDSAGALWLCTTGGSPGTWTGGTPAPVSLVGENGATSSNLGARLVNGGATVELAGRVLNNSGATINSGIALLTLPDGYRPSHQIKMGARYTGGGQTLTIDTTGALSLGGNLTTGQELFLDGVTFVVAGTWL